MRIFRPPIVCAATSAVSLLALGMVGRSSAWTVSPSLVFRCSETSFHSTPIANPVRSRGFAATGRNKLGTSRCAASPSSHHNVVVENENNDWTEFDYLLHEEASLSKSTATTTGSVTSTASSSSSSRQAVRLGGTATKSNGVVVLVSTAVSPGGTLTDASDTSSSGGDYDPYASDMDYQQQQQHLGKIQQQQQNTAASLEGRLQKMDLQDIVITLIIPGILSFVSLRWGFNQVASRVSTNADTILDGFAREMIHHDGRFDEMRMCHADYSRQLVWMGPKKGDAMLKRYLAAYAKKKTVSPQSIRYVSLVLHASGCSRLKCASIVVASCPKNCVWQYAYFSDILLCILLFLFQHGSMYAVAKQNYRNAKN